ncbi:PREDICTED: cdc42 effector protein 4 [Nanorana parkeri]|uniref:cdc42 effector protein 4 n=1 Tax=Nanorana parkeri TaxID=125878 RepID=UPI000853F2E2|nr:PREDICTED: cdc42 effector protein 4 [Nanorana parkeri]
MPILKQMVANPNASKRRSRADLTAEMISAPLGDFRHTMHIGRAGDAFGDTSFLSKPEDQQEPEESTSKPGLLSRTFRNSKRSLSVTRGDRRDMLGSLRDSALFVKNAVSLPQLTEKEAEKSSSKKMPKSLSSSPVKKVPEEQQYMNGASSRSPAPVPDLVQAEKEFGDLTDLPDSAPKSSYGMKHAESIMSFHIDLGPSMLGDILSIMDSSQWEQDLDLSIDKLDGNGANSQRSVPSKQTGPSAIIPSTKADHGSLPAPSKNHQQVQPTKEHHSVSRGSSGAPEGKPKKGRDLSFMDEEEEDDEIRV